MHEKNNKNFDNGRSKERKYSSRIWEVKII